MNEDLNWAKRKYETRNLNFLGEKSHQAIKHYRLDEKNETKVNKPKF